MITEQDEKVITDVIIAYTIMTIDLRKADKQHSIKALQGVIAEWIEPRSEEFKLLFADTARNLADKVGPKKPNLGEVDHQCYSVGD